MASAAKTLRVSFVQCRGTPYEVGRAQADAFAQTRKGKAFLRRKMRLPPWFDMRAEERAFKAYAPALWEEIGGIGKDGVEGFVAECFHGLVDRGHFHDLCVVLECFNQSRIGLAGKDEDFRLSFFHGVPVSQGYCIW